LPSVPYTFDEMRADLVRAREGKISASPSNPIFSRPELLAAVAGRLIALIDAMTPEERALSNVLQISRPRREQIAAQAGGTVRDLESLLAGRQSVELVSRLFSRS
jgi:hypothetical protein